MRPSVRHRRFHFSALLSLSALFLLLACRGSIHELGGDLCTLRVRTDFDAAARTVVPDFSKEFDSLLISLTNNDGYAAPASQTDTAAPWQVGFSVQPGSWNIQVAALRSGVTVGSGTKTVTLASGLVDPVIVPLSFDAGAATGDVRFAVRFPSGLGIDYVHGLITDTGVGVAPDLTTSGGSTSGTFEFSGLAPSLDGEAYTLVLTFKRGGSTGTVAGVFREKIIVVGGFTSGSWVGPNGELLSERAFSEDEFSSTEASLDSLSISGDVFDGAAFNPAILTYTITEKVSLGSTITFTAAGSAAGQYLEYSWNGGDFTEVRSEFSSPALSCALPNTLEVRVTAPDRETQKVYRLTFCGTISYPCTGGSLAITLYGDILKITDCDASVTSADIPATIDGYSVVGIAAGAFQNCTALSDIVLPDSITSIGSYAFQNCSKIQYIRFMSMEPPDLGTGGLHTGATEPEFYVPVGALAAYQAAAAIPASAWSNYGALLQEWPY